MFRNIRSTERGLTATAYTQDPDLIVHDGENATIKYAVPSLEKSLTNFKIEFGVLCRNRAS